MRKITVNKRYCNNPKNSVILFIKMTSFIKGQQNILLIFLTKSKLRKDLWKRSYIIRILSLTYIQTKINVMNVKTLERAAEVFSKTFWLAFTVRKNYSVFIWVNNNKWLTTQTKIIFHCRTFNDNTNIFKKVIRFYLLRAFLRALVTVFKPNVNYWMKRFISLVL